MDMRANQILIVEFKFAFYQLNYMEFESDSHQNRQEKLQKKFQSDNLWLYVNNLK